MLSYGIVEIEETRIGFMLLGEIEWSSWGLDMRNALYAKKGGRVSRQFLKFLTTDHTDVSNEGFLNQLRSLFSSLPSVKIFLAPAGQENQQKETKVAKGH